MREKETIIMIHGWGQTSDSFRRLEEELDGEYKVIAPDLEGFGARRGNPGPYTFNRYAGQIQQLAESLGLEDGGFHLLGWSMGGSVAARYVLEKASPAPRSLILMSAIPRFIAPGSAIGAGQSKTAVYKLRKQLEADHAKTLATFIEMIFMAGEEISREVETAIRPLLTPEDSFPPTALALISTLDELAATDLTLHPAAGASVDGLIIYGTLDKICPMGGQRLWDQVFANLEKSPLENLGHAPHLTNSGKTAMMIIDFLKRLNRA